MNRNEFIYSRYSDSVGMRLLKQMSSLILVEGINLYTPVSADPAIIQKTKDIYERKIPNPMSFEVVENKIRNHTYKDQLTYDFLSDIFLIPQNVQRFDPLKQSVSQACFQKLFEIYPELQNDSQLDVRITEQLAVISAYLCRCSEQEFLDLFDADADINTLSFVNYLKVYRTCLIGLQNINGTQTSEILSFDEITVNTSVLNQTYAVVVEYKSEISEAQGGITEPENIKKIDDMNVEELRFFLKGLQRK
ncbi:Bromodomain [Hexamita inflata]|uniref:Bromodomain n=1 Tax=Hexamita inflata TaxID=28002 RepID=A0AA86PYZ0_9EUKA|nr:Bromodomain [Hexamita inflata]